MRKDPIGGRVVAFASPEHQQRETNAVHFLQRPGGDYWGCPDGAVMLVNKQSGKRPLVVVYDESNRDDYRYWDFFEDDNGAVFDDLQTLRPHPAPGRHERATP